MIKIIATDMDHTLLDDQSILPKEFHEMLNELADKDIEFVCSSGRTLQSLHRKVGNEKDRISFVSDNGSVVEYRGEIIFKSIINPKSWHEMVKIGRQSKEASIVLTTSDCAYAEIDNLEHEKMLSEYYPHFEICDDLCALNVDVIKLTYMSLNHTVENYDTYIYPNFGKDFNTVRAGHMWIDIMNENINKGNGLKKLLEKFSLTSDNLMAFGDFHNDIEMLQLAKHSYAVSNAHQDVKEIANEIIGSNNENSVINTIYNKVLNK